MKFILPLVEDFIKFFHRECMDFKILVALLVNKFVSRQQIVLLYILLVPISSCADIGLYCYEKEVKEKRVPNTPDNQLP